MIGAQNVSGLGHEMHAAKDQVFGFATARSVLRELERIASQIGVADHVVALVMVTENHCAVAEFLFGLTDAVVKLLLAQTEIVINRFDCRFASRSRRSCVHLCLPLRSDL